MGELQDTRPDPFGSAFAQFRAKVETSLDARGSVAAQNQREEADKASLAVILLVVNAVKYDPEKKAAGEGRLGKGLL